MADLLGQFDVVLESAKEFGNFMLKTDEQSHTSGELVDELLVELLLLSRWVAFPGYSPDWLKGVDTIAPAWAHALNRRMCTENDVYRLSPKDAAAKDVREFWVEGSFFCRAQNHDESQVQFRPGIPIITLAPDALGRDSLRKFVTGFVGFASDLATRGGYYRKSIRFVRSAEESEPQLLYLLYQDASWLMFLGATPVLHEGLRVIRDTLIEDVANRDDSV